MIPTNWKIERKNSIYEQIEITAPNGYSAIVSRHDRNPENVLYMLADDLLKAQEAAAGVQGDVK